MTLYITILLYFHVQIKMCYNEIETDNIIQLYFQDKTAKAVKKIFFFKQLPNIFPAFHSLSHANFTVALTLSTYFSLSMNECLF